jgi:RNA polymerase sigma-70 factor (ECF subfamily)
LFDFERLYGESRSAGVSIAMRQTQRAEDRRRDIFDSHRHRTFALAYYMTGNEIEAEKILTNTFITAFKAAEEPTANHVDNALLGELRATLPLDVQSPPMTQDQTPAAKSDLSDRNIRRTDLEEALATLPAQERLLYLLRDVEGYTPAHIAGLLQMPEAQVNRTLMSARLRLRRALLAEEQARAEAA